MESTCSEDLQQMAIAYCACRFPLPALCQQHAEKHFRDSHGFHFTLPLSASQVITSEEMYLQVKQWLLQLNENYDVLRKKYQLLANGEAQIEAVYQDLLRLAYESKIRLQQEFSAKREVFRTEIEQAIMDTRSHALEAYEPVHVLAKLLWHNQPHENFQIQLFTFQAECMQEHLPSVFHIALNFVLGLEHLKMGKSVPPLTDQIELLTQHLEFKVESIKALSLEVEDANARGAGTQQKLQEVNLKLQMTERQLQTLRTDYQETKTRLLKLETDNTALVKQCKSQEVQLTAYFQSRDYDLKGNTELKAQVQQLNLTLQTAKQQYQTLLAKWKDRKERCSRLKRENGALQIEVNQLKAAENDANQGLKTQAEVNQKNSLLEARLRKWGITTDPPTNFQEPNYSTPQSRTTLANFGPYIGLDDELVLFKRAPVADDCGVYIGHWNCRGQKHGYGKYLWKNGDIYEGHWRSGWRTGKGRFISANDGDVYIGDFVQNKMEGFGTYYFADGDEYTGAWVNDKRNGVGSFKFGEASQWTGDRYIGEYLDNKMNGLGAYFWADGDMYVGERISGDKHGKGLLVLADGEMYSGDFEDDELSGTGCYVWPSGDVYRGAWEQGKSNGQGRLTHPGAIEEGTWVNNVLRGKGRRAIY